MSIFKMSSRKELALLQRTKELSICENDIEETFIRAPGPEARKQTRHLPV